MSAGLHQEASLADAATEQGGIYQGWKILGLAMLMSIAAAGPIYYAYGNYALAFADEYGASRTVINLGYTVVMLVGNIGSAPVGWLLSRWSVGRVALVGAVGTGVGLALVSVTTAMWQVLLLFTTLIAFADVFLGVVVVNYLLCHWFERRRGLALSLAQIGSSAGAVIFPPLTALLTINLGWRPVFLIYGGLVLLLIPAILVYARVPNTMPVRERLPQAGTPVQGLRFTYRTIWKHSGFWILTLCTGSMIGINGGTMISLVPFTKSIGLGVSAGALLLSIIGTTAILGKIGFGLVADRIDLKWALRAALLCFALGQGLFAMSNSLLMLQLGAVFAGLSLGGMMPVWGLVAARVFGLPSYGVALGGTRTAMTPLAFLCPMLAGIVFDLYGSYQLAWFFYMALALFACAATFANKHWADPITVK